MARCWQKTHCTHDWRIEWRKAQETEKTTHLQLEVKTERCFVFVIFPAAGKNGKLQKIYIKIKRVIKSHPNVYQLWSYICVATNHKTNVARWSPMHWLKPGVLIAIVGQHCPPILLKHLVNQVVIYRLKHLKVSKKRGVVHKYMTTIVERSDDSLFYTVNTENDWRGPKIMHH